MNRRALIFVLVALLTTGVSAQKNSYNKRVFVDAEYYLLYEEYKDALPLYQELLKAYPTSANYCYRIALCYLNIPQQRKKSIPYFERAIKNTSETYREGFFTEQQAPYEAFLNYGKVLRITHDFNKADSILNIYKAYLTQKEKNTSLVDKELESVSLARQMIANPKNHIIRSVGRNINSLSSEINPLSDSTMQTIIYTSIQKLYNAILISRRDTGFWANPTNLNAQLLADGGIKTVGISSNGKVLILARNDNDTYNLYYSTFDNQQKKWKPITKFPREINSRSGENYGSLTPNADTLFFSSCRPGGFGGFDIYMSIKKADGSWSNPINLGAEVNTSGDEIAPFITRNGKKLVFSSNGHKTMGGFDLFYCTRNSNGWDTPINFGYPLSTTDDDTYLFPLGNGAEAIFHREMDNNSGENDIYHVKIDYPKH